MDVMVREAVPDDWQECGRICYEAFATLAARHGFPPDFPTVAAAPPGTQVHDQGIGARGWT